MSFTNMNFNITVILGCTLMYSTMRDYILHTHTLYIYEEFRCKSL